MSNNEFWGRVPVSLAGLSQLMELYLENNRFSGAIPRLEQANLVEVNLSNNDLEGEIPSGMSGRFGPGAFEGNNGLCGGHTGRACGSTPPGPGPSSVGHEGKGSSNKGLKIAMWCLVAFAAVLVLMVVGIFVMKQRNRRSSNELLHKENLDGNPILESVRKNDVDSSRKGLGSAHRTGSGYRSGSSKRGSTKDNGNDLVMMNYDKGEFGLADLMRASAEMLGTGAIGSSYKAIMNNGATLVVKRMKEVSKMGRDKFDMEMRRFGGLKHKNVLAPLGYRYRKDEKLLVFEFQSKGSLEFLLHGGRGSSHSELTWPVRFKITQGIAGGLGYLHDELSSFSLPHGNFKSSNVLLTPDYKPLLVDYGLYSLINQ